MSHETVVVLDFGSQTTQLIARRVREAGVYCEIHPCTTPAAEVAAMQPSGLILSGGPMSVTDDGAPQLDPALLDLRQPKVDASQPGTGDRVPVLGICYGLQALAHALGGAVEASDHREFGRSPIVAHEEDALFRGVPEGSVVWMSHGDHLTRLPAGFRAIAATDNAPIAAVAAEPDSDHGPVWGVQFHPEVVHSEHGAVMLGNFVREICGLRGDWTTGSFIDEKVEEVRQRVGDDHVILGLSGGVDSSVAAALLHRAIGDQLTCVFVDNGLLRHGEFEQVQKTFADGFDLDLVAVDASGPVLGPAGGRRGPGGEAQDHRADVRRGVRAGDAEGDRAAGEQAEVSGPRHALPRRDRERVSFKGPSATIKTHHNVGGLPEKLGFELVEPFRELFKDEVRAVGRELGVPEAIIKRHPFPGPGLAVRILGPVTREACDLLRQADRIWLEELVTSGTYDEVWQAFAVLLPIKSVGVMGDFRTYEQAVTLRAVTSTDGMTADWARLPYEVLGRASNRIINEVRGINRVAYDVSSKPPATIEWE